MKLSREPLNTGFRAIYFDIIWGENSQMESMTKPPIPPKHLAKDFYINLSPIYWQFQ